MLAILKILINGMTIKKKKQFLSIGIIWKC